MALGSITSLGVGSGFELQEMLDSLRKVDEATITLKEANKEKLEAQLTEFDSLNAKLINFKSSALALSLESNFLERSVATSDKEVAGATALHGTKIASYSLEVKRLASKSSWQSQGIETGSALIYSAPETSYTSDKQSVTTNSTPISFTVGQGASQKTISLEVASGSSLSDIALAINTDDGNLNEEGETHVTASVVTGTGGGKYIRLSSTEDNTLANNQILVSQGPGFIAPDLTFSYKTGATGSPVYVNVPPGSTYQDTVSLINGDKNNSGITAKLIDDGSSENPWHLTITADNEGEAHRIFLDNIAMTEMQGAENASLNASFSVDGYDYQRQSNKGLEDVIQGVTLNLEKVGETSLGISAETESMKEEITELINTYNEIVEEINTKTQYDEDAEKDGILSDVYSIKTLGKDLLSVLTTAVDTDGSINSLMDMGIELNKDGSLSVDQDKLSLAFSSSPEGVANLFISDTEEDRKGLGDLLNDRLKDMTSSTGAVNAEKTAAEEKIDRLTTNIESAKEVLDKRYDVLAEQFVRLDSYIGTMNSQSKYLTSIFDSFNNSQQK